MLSLPHPAAKGEKSLSFLFIHWMPSHLMSVERSLLADKVGVILQNIKKCWDCVSFTINSWAFIFFFFILSSEFNLLSDKMNYLSLQLRDWLKLLWILDLPRKQRKKQVTIWNQIPSVFIYVNYMNTKTITHHICLMVHKVFCVIELFHRMQLVPSSASVL